MKALVNIKHGKADGTIIELQPGDDVPSDAFTKEEAKSLIDAGAVGKVYDPDAPAVRPENTSDVEPADSEPKGDGRRTASKE